MHYLKRILGCIKKADNDFNLINDGDKIVIGVSGGKDSLLLLLALNSYKKMIENQKKFEIIPLHINIGFPNTEINLLKEQARIIGCEIIEVNSSIYEILKEHKEHNGRLPCSICSRMKKAVIVNYAKEHNCNKVSFAHHGDDAIETLLMNAIYGGRIATFSPKMYLDDSNITFIRPLVYAHESDIVKAFNKSGLSAISSSCPNDKKTQREEMKKMLKELYRKYPFAKDNFLLMLHNNDKLDLWEKEKGS